ncbi:dTDP-4-amino-4,6-dideoxygalactose transaminase [Eubacterium aggregans]|uniref:dTDP-4-amino-4,6-dideoxygalactose transaminase n=1 Tax=Eubacterium aggregans TaxID=81409 RepID=A0A1H3YAJ9_9FIRM|nr:DegT/DnrJ/EryC1/StrS family aminotransferase [Eubacterium aggregans]SEA07918.1 dTDP-4-amino-4,6-dideoxygalactose transaminase [Eubacterium aggregans]
MEKNIRNIPFSPPDIREEDINEVIAALKSGWITTGPRTKAFEKELSKFYHTKRTACLSSATTALELTLRLCGIGPGDEVIVPAYTYTASASPVLHVGAKLILIDADPDSFLISPKKVAEAITEKTKAIIPVDLGGVMCDYDALFEVVKERKNLFSSSDNPIQQAFGRVLVIADGAHSLGATYKGRMSGEVADFTTFSFHAVKNLTTAEGGAVTWKPIPGMKDDELYNDFMLGSLHGQSKDALAKTQKGSWEYDIVYPAYKCNMTDIQAALGLIQLKRYEQSIARRKAIIKKYNEAFKDLPVTTLCHETENSSSSGHLYLMRVRGLDEEKRNQLIINLAGEGISTNVHYKPLPMHTGYQKLGFDIKDYPNAYAQYKNEITLPLHTCLADEEIEYVCQSFRSAFKR